MAIHLITEHIRTKLQQHDLRRIYPNLEVIPSTYQVQEWNAHMMCGWWRKSYGLCINSLADAWHAHNHT